jgi:hypothetical protein
MDLIREKYLSLCQTPSDIFEHLPILCKYASDCESVLELGVRGCVSSWAFLYGLLLNQKPKKVLLMNDLLPCDIQELLNVSKQTDVIIDYCWANDLQLVIHSELDLTFIDTWHVYGQLKRELEKFSQITKKYIIMHDTTIDEIHSESVRLGFNIQQQCIETGWERSEIECGLWKAIEEFLETHPEWSLHQRFFNNNGLTILKRKN